MLKIADGYKTTRLLDSTIRKGPEGDEHSIRVVSTFDSAAVDSFGLLRSSSPYTIFESKQVTGPAPLFWDQVLIGGGTATHVPVDSAVEMTVAADGDAVIRQTFMRFNYQSGKGQRIKLTGLIGEPVAGTNAKIGYFNTSTDSPFTSEIDGMWFDSGETSISVNLGKTGSVRSFSRSDWNMDKLDGSGPSGLDVDFDKAQIFFFDFAWLSLGQVRCGIQLGGTPYYCHAFTNINELVGAYMSSPNHSARYEVRSTGGVKTAKHICCSIESEGGIEPSGVSIHFDNGTTGIPTSQTPVSLLTFRLRESEICSTVVPSLVNVLAATKGNFRWRLMLNATVANLTAFTPEPLTSVEVAQGASNQTVSGGFAVAGGYVADGSSEVKLEVRTLINPGISIAGTRDTFTLQVQTLSAPSETFYGSVSAVDINCGTAT